MGTATSKRPVTHSLVYCVVISNDTFGDATFRDYVTTQQVFFHPVVGGSRPTIHRTSSRSAGTTRCARSTAYSTTRPLLISQSGSRPSRTTTQLHRGHRATRTSSTPRPRHSAPRRRHPQRRTEPACTTLLGPPRPTPDSTHRHRRPRSYECSRRHLIDPGHETPGARPPATARKPHHDQEPGRH